MTSLLLLFCLPSTLLLLPHALRPAEEGVKSGGGILLVDFDGSDFFDDGVVDGGGIDDGGIGATGAGTIVQRDGQQNHPLAYQDALSLP